MNYTNNGNGPTRSVDTRGLVPEIEGYARAARGGAEAASPPTPIEPTGLVVLSKPYRAHDVDVTRFRLRRPVTREIRAYGNPFKVKLTPQGMIEDIVVQYDAVAKYVAVLSDPPLPPSTVDLFEYEDIDSCAAALMPFFMRLAS